jgi:hypothetical protein
MVIKRMERRRIRGRERSRTCFAKSHLLAVNMGVETDDGQVRVWHGIGFEQASIGPYEGVSECGRWGTIRLLALEF